MNQEKRSAQTCYEDFYGMLADAVRMKAYKKAIFNNVKQGDIVLDLGAGTGILSFLALQAGASRVYAIEKSDSIELAKQISKTNGFDDKIVFINDNSINIELSEKVDVIISETLGSFGVDENTLEFTLDARDRFLKDDGLLIPNGIKMYLCPVEAKQSYGKIDFWSEIEGINFSPARNIFTQKIMIEDFQVNQFLSEPVLFKELDFYKESRLIIENLNYFKFDRAGVVHGFAGWFDLSLDDNNIISTHPSCKPTHWKQAFFPAQEPVSIIKGDMLELNLEVSAQCEYSDNTNIQYNFRCTQLANEQTHSVGRNELCPCKSGKKHKKCCLSRS